MKKINNVKSKKNTVSLKKIICAVAGCAVLTTGSICAVYADEPVLTSSADKYSVTVNGENLNLTDNDIYMQGDCVMVPLRAVAEKLGFKVEWDDNTQSISLDDGIVGTKIEIGCDNYYMVSTVAVGMSAPTPLGAAPVLKGDKTYVPAEMFKILLGNTGYEVNGKKVEFTKDDNKDATQIPNPIVDYNTVDAALKTLDFTPVYPKSAPLEYKLDNVSVIGGEIFQLIYIDGENNEIRFRAAKGSEDISGDYNVYKNHKIFKAGNMEINVRGNENIAGATWNDGGITYSVYFEKEISQDELAKTVLALK